MRTLRATAAPPLSRPALPVRCTSRRGALSCSARAPRPCATRLAVTPAAPLATSAAATALVAHQPRVVEEAQRTAAPVPALLLALAAAAPLLVAAPAFAEEAAAAAGAVGDFQNGFVEAFLLIFFSEIGDKTFFIAVLLALQQPRGTVFAGTFGALAVMTVISVALGRLLHVADEALPLLANSTVPWDDYAAVALLLFFGLKTLAGAAESEAKGEEEEADAREAVAELDAGEGSLALLASTFTLVFAAEWGDKSFLATIALSAAADPAGVVAGAVAGHGTATALAVAGGSLLGQYVSEKVVAYAGGTLFLVFAAATAVPLLLNGGAAP